MLWEIDIHPAEGQPDRAAERIATAARELKLANDLRVATHVDFVQGRFARASSGWRKNCWRTSSLSGR